MDENQREIIKRRTNDGKSSAPSRGVVVLNVSPPKFNTFKKNPSDEATINNLTYNNIYVYNFYTMNERNKYSYKNSEFDFTEVRGIDGKKVQKNDNNTLRKVSGFIPSFIRLSWDNSHSWSPASVASHHQIEQFKKLVGIKNYPTHDSDINEFNRFPIRGPQPERGGVTFETHQRDYVAVTNEYLDMFSDLTILAPPATNPWFAEEIDAFQSISRLTFLQNEVIGGGNDPYKNFLNVYGQSGQQFLDPHQRLIPQTQISESIPTVQDSAMLEDLQYPFENRTPDITLILNSEAAAEISRSSLKSCGNILSTQSQIRNLRHLIEHNVNQIENQAGYQTPLDKILSESTYYSETILEPSAPKYISDFRIVGFVIEKREKSKSPSGELGAPNLKIKEKYPLIFVPCSRNPDESDPFMPNTYLDTALNYGSVYSYNIRSVFTFSLKVQSGNETRVRHYLVNSGYSRTIEIDCLETTPPPPPRDFDIFFDYTLKNQRSPGKPRLTWSFPVNPQRDTAGFAIFRRGNIYEPFNLIKIIDFNFSNPSRRGNDYKFEIRGSDKNSIIKFCGQNDTFTDFVDEGFKNNQNYMYTICSIDAHGQISNYGTQILVNYDYKSDTLKKEQVSPPGSPLIFPNWFLKTKAFPDVARISNYRRANLKFRPDYKEIKVGPNNVNQKIVNGIDPDDGGHADNAYYLQIINPDRSNDIVLKYQINDILEKMISSEELQEVADHLGVSLEDLG